MNKFIVIGLIIVALYFLINRFVVRIPGKIAAPVMLIGIACFVVGFVRMKQQGSI